MVERKSTAWLLNISKVNGYYIFQFGEARSNPLMRQVRHDVPLGIREKVLERFNSVVSDTVREKVRGAFNVSSKRGPISNGSSHKSLEKLSHEITRLLVPREILTEIDASDAGSLILSTNDPAVPWELLHLKDGLLLQRYPLGRIIPVNERVSPRPQTDAKSVVRILVLANPTSDLPGADEEYRRLKRMFDRDAHFTADYLIGTEVTISNILKLADAHSYDLVHYSGHSDFDPRSGEGVVIFAEGPVSASYLVDLIGTDASPIFFFNSCSSSTMGGDKFSAGHINGIVGSFLRAGARAFIGAIWPVVDETAIEIACEFYERLGGGASIGAALNAARFQVPSSPDDLTWMGYSLVGNPELCVVSDQQWRGQSAASDGHMAAREAWSHGRTAVVGGFHPIWTAADRRQIAPLLVSSECTGSQKLVLPRNSSVKSLEELRGACIAFPPLSGMEFFFWHMVEDANLSQSDFSVVHLQQGEIISALRSNRVDAAVVWEPHLTALMMEGFEIVEPTTKQTDYTICVLATDRDHSHDGPIVQPLLARYAHCLDYIRLHRALGVGR